MKRVLLFLVSLAVVAALAACTPPNDLDGKIDTDLWEVRDRPDTEVPNQYPDGRATDSDESHGDEESGEEEGHD